MVQLHAATQEKVENMDMCFSPTTNNTLRKCFVRYFNALCNALWFLVQSPLVIVPAMKEERSIFPGTRVPAPSTRVNAVKIHVALL